MEFRLGFDEIFWPWKKPKSSRKIREKAKKYLSEKGVDLDSLTEPQQQCVFAHIREKSTLKIGGALSIFFVIISAIIAFQFYSFLTDHIRFFRIPDDIVREYSIEESMTLDLETIENYGKVCVILAGCCALMMLACIYNLVNFVSMILNKRKIEKILNAFLSTPDANLIINLNKK